MSSEDLNHNLPGTVRSPVPTPVAPEIHIHEAHDAPRPFLAQDEPKFVWDQDKDASCLRRSMSDPTLGKHHFLMVKPASSRRRSSKRVAEAMHPKEADQVIVEHITTKQARREVIKCILIGLLFLLLVNMPKIVDQAHQDAFLHSLSSTHPAKLKVDNFKKGIIEVKITAGECAVPVGYSGTVPTLTAKIVQEGGTFAEADGDIALNIVTEDTSTSTNYTVHRRLSGGSSVLPHNSVSKLVHIDVPDGVLQDDKDVFVMLETNCQSTLAVITDNVPIGVVGRVQVWLALIILFVVLTLILTEIIHRTIAAFLGAASVLFVLSIEHRLPSVPTIIVWMDHGTLALLWGMMIIVALLARTGVFEWSAVRVFQISGGSMWKLFVLIMVFDCFCSAFLDNVTTMLLLCPVILSLCKAIDVPSKPMLISLALFGNIGGTATMIGDPPNIIIGNALSDYIGFTDFLVVLGPGVVLMTPFAMGFARYYYGSAYFATDISCDTSILKAHYPIREPRLLIRATIVLGSCILMFFLHPVTHLDPAYVACFGAVLLLLLCGHNEFEYAVEKVEWDSLLFFAALFVFTEGLAELGLLNEIAVMLSSAIEAIPVDSRQLCANIILHIVCAVVSAFVDNIPFTTTMIPVIQHMTDNVEGLTLKPLAWSLAFGACLGGMGTLIGASANVVMAGIAEEGHQHISFLEFFKIGWPMMCICIAVSCIYMILLQSVGAFDE